MVRIADRIAYINHDIDDAQRAGVLRPEDIPKEVAFRLGNRRSARINTLVRSLVENSRGGELRMAPEVQEAFDKLHDFMYTFVYRNPYAKAEEKRCRGGGAAVSLLCRPSRALARGTCPGGARRRRAARCL